MMESKRMNSVNHQYESMRSQNNFSKLISMKDSDGRQSFKNPDQSFRHHDLERSEIFSNISRKDHFEEQDFGLMLNDVIERLTYDQICLLLTLHKQKKLTEFKKLPTKKRV